MSVRASQFTRAAGRPLSMGGDDAAEPAAQTNPTSDRVDSPRAATRMCVARVVNDLCDAAGVDHHRLGDCPQGNPAFYFGEKAGEIQKMGGWPDANNSVKLFISEQPVDLVVEIGPGGLDESALKRHAKRGVSEIWRVRGSVRTGDANLEILALRSFEVRNKATRKQKYVSVGWSPNLGLEPNKLAWLINTSEAGLAGSDALDRAARRVRAHVNSIGQPRTESGKSALSAQALNTRTRRAGAPPRQLARGSNARSVLMASVRA